MLVDRLRGQTTKRSADAVGAAFEIETVVIGGPGHDIEQAIRGGASARLPNRRPGRTSSRIIGAMSAGTEPEDERGSLRCPACRGNAFIRRSVLPDLTTSECRACGLILSRIERTAPAIPEFALVDQPAYLRSVGASRRRQAQDILDRLIDRVSPGAKLLDVGCSFGFFLQAARKVGFKIEGIEPDPDASAYARRLLGDDVVHQGLLDTDLARSTSADIVSTLDVIEHIRIEEHPAFAEMIRTVLEPAGIWVIKVPSSEGLYYKLSDLLVRAYPSLGAGLVRRMWQTRYEYPHLTYFSLRSLSLWLDRFGFDVIGHRYLPEVPPGTVIDRLTTDGDIGRAKAYLAAPAVLGVNMLDRLRGKSDALVMFARPRA